MPLQRIYRAASDHAHRLLLRVQVTEPFAIISNNCWGAGFYRDLERPYNTPFVGTHVPPPCYLKLISDLPGYLAQPLRFIPKSRYSFPTRWPIAELGDIEVHFMHYADENEARAKWTRRIERLPDDSAQWRLKFCDHHVEPGPEADALIAEFDRHPHPHKVCFLARHKPELKSAIPLREYFPTGRVPDGHALYRPSLRYFHAASWLNGESTRTRSPFAFARTPAAP